MKPFNLERALAGGKVVTHDSPVIELKFLEKAPKDQCVVAVVDCGDGYIHSEIFGEDGERYSQEYSSAPLTMATKKRTFWVSMFRDTHTLEKFIGMGVFKTEAEAKASSKCYKESEIIGVFPLEIEE
jgi:hypothetical protein